MEFPITELGPADNPEVGEQAPDFERPLVSQEYWADASLSELVADGPVLLVFHPMDGSFPAIYAWNEIAERDWDDRFDVEVVGLSISSPYEHAEFLEFRDLDYRLFSDPANGVAEAYGVAHDLDGMAGVSEPRPAFFLLDEERTVQYAWAGEDWPAFPPYDEIEAAIEEHAG